MSKKKVRVPKSSESKSKGTKGEKTLNRKAHEGPSKDKRGASRSGSGQSRRREKREIETHQRRGDSDWAAKETAGKTSAVIEKAGFLIYTGPVQANLAEAIGKQRDDRSDALLGGQR